MIWRQHSLIDVRHAVPKHFIDMDTCIMTGNVTNVLCVEDSLFLDLNDMS